jgi:hypothetical protein
MIQEKKRGFMMPNSTFFTSALKSYDYYNYVLNKVQTKETNLVENNDDEITNDLVKYIIISIIFIVSFLFIIIIFIKIYKICCKKDKIKNRLLISECCRGCCVCLCHKYTAEFSKIKAHNSIDSIKIENELPIMITSSYRDKNSYVRQNIIYKYLRNFYSFKNKNNSNSENESTILNCISSQTLNNSSSFFTQNESLLLISNLFKENFKDYNDIDLGFLTNDIFLTDSHLNSETSI